SHTYDSGLEVELRGPDGTTVKLFDGAGGDGHNFIATTLDDEAGSSIFDGEAPFTGRFRPEGSLSDFDGRSSAGPWTLRVADNYNVGPGAIVGWRLDMRTSGGRRSYANF